jgi:hypothetical protein
VRPDLHRKAAELAPRCSAHMQAAVRVNRAISMTKFESRPRDDEFAGALILIDSLFSAPYSRLSITFSRMCTVRSTAPRSRSSTACAACPMAAHSDS